MRIRLNIQKIDRYILLGLFPVLMLDQLVLCRYGTKTYISSVILRLAVLYLGVKAFTRTPASAFKQLFTGYLVFNAMTGAAYIFNDMPLSCYFRDLWDFLLPMLFFYIGYSGENTDNRFYISFLWSCIFCFVVGMYLYFSTPPWYVARIAEMRNEHWAASVFYSEDTRMELARFGSYWGNSYAIQFFGVYAYIICLSHLIQSVRIPRNTIWLFSIAASICGVAVILSQQRVAIFFVALSTAGWLCYAVIRRRVRAVLPILWMGAGVAVLFYFLSGYSVRIEHILNLLRFRAESFDLSWAFTARSEQYAQIMERWSSYWLGHGLGTGGHEAIRCGYIGVTDGNYVKLAFESGLLGLAWFGILMLTSIIRALKNYRNMFIEFNVVCYVLLAMIGSNALGLYVFYVAIFWHCLGRIWNLNYLKSMEMAPP